MNGIVRREAVVALGLLLAVACDKKTETPSTPAPPDAGVDAGQPVDGGMDAGMTMDGGMDGGQTCSVIANFTITISGTPSCDSDVDGGVGTVNGSVVDQSSNDWGSPVPCETNGSFSTQLQLPQGTYTAAASFAGTAHPGPTPCDVTPSSFACTGNGLNVDGGIAVTCTVP